MSEWGGKRTGAGRKPRAPKISEKQRRELLPDDIELAERIALEGNGRRGRMQRVVLALAAHGASTREIAAALTIPEDRVRSDYADQLEVGGLLQFCTGLTLISWRARQGSMPAILWLLKRTDPNPSRQRRQPKKPIRGQ